MRISSSSWHHLFVPDCNPLIGIAGTLLVVVAVKTPYSNIADQITHVFWGTKAGLTIPYLIVVHDDVDPFNMTEVIHALASKCHPYRGIHKVEQTRGNQMWPFLTERERQHTMGSCVYFDCTWPVDWYPSRVPPRASFDSNYPKELQEMVLKNWKNYGYAEL